MGDKTLGDVRTSEVRADLPSSYDCGLYFIGRIRTPWTRREDCPRQGDLDGPLCRIEVEPRWRAALAGVEQGARAQILYWMHEARRDLVLQAPRGGRLTGTFALRSPVRPNPIALSEVRIEAVEPGGVAVRGLDCVDGTPLIDIKPFACPNWGRGG